MSDIVKFIESSYLQPMYIDKKGIKDLRRYSTTETSLTTFNGNTYRINHSLQEVFKLLNIPLFRYVPNHYIPIHNILFLTYRNNIIGINALRDYYEITGPLYHCVENGVEYQIDVNRFISLLEESKEVKKKYTNLKVASGGNL